MDESPTRTTCRIDGVSEPLFPEVLIVHRTAQIAAGRSKILRGKAHEIAIGLEVTVRIGPGPGDSRGNARVRIGDRVAPVVVAGRLQVLAEITFSEVFPLPNKS